MTETANGLNPLLEGKAEQLYAMDLKDAYAVLGIQAQQADMRERRTAEDPRRVPPWSDTAAFDKVIGGERGMEDFAMAGLGRAQDLLDAIGAQLREVLCEDGDVRKEVLALEDDVRSLIKYLSGTLTGLLMVNAPAAIGAAVVAMATTLAIILIKNNLHKYCAAGAVKLIGS